MAADETLLARVVLVFKQMMYHSGQIGKKLDCDDYKTTVELFIACSDKSTSR